MEIMVDLLGACGLRTSYVLLGLIHLHAACWLRKSAERAGHVRSSSTIPTGAKRILSIRTIDQNSL